MFQNSDECGVLKPSDATNRTENSLRTSAISFAYQSERENCCSQKDLQQQLEDQISENMRLRKQLIEEIERNKSVGIRAEVKQYIQKLNDDWNQKYDNQFERFTQILNKKEAEINNLNKYARQLEVENKLLCSAERGFDKPRDQLEHKINILLNENEKLNLSLQERITQIERMKQQTDQKDIELKQCIEKYELIIQEKANLFQKEKQAIEKAHNQMIASHKNEFLKQIQFLNAQNSQLSTLLCEQKAKFEQLELQLESSNEILLSERKQVSSKEGEIKEVQSKLERKEKEYQDVLVKFNELEKKLLHQNQQLGQLEKQMEENHYQSVIQEMQEYFDGQMRHREEELKQQYETQQQHLMNQLNENQNFIEELQNHLSDIHRQITKFKQEKQQLKQQNQELQMRLEEVQTKNYSLPSFNNTTIDSSMDTKKSFVNCSNLGGFSNCSKMQGVQQQCQTSQMLPQQMLQPLQQQQQLNACISQLKQYSLNSTQKSYSQQFQQKLKKIKSDNSPNRFELDSFGNKDRSMSCLQMAQTDYHIEDEEDEEEDINPIEQFKMWKQQFTERQ